MTLETPKTEDWFDNVENLRPLRGGRRAETLNEIASGAIRVSSEEAETKFRQDLELAAGHEDPLSVMWSFANWFEEHFPTGKHRIFYPMLYKICLTYSSMERYRNDERMLKLWLKLAESFPESALAVMEFAHTRGSCRELAKFYVRWSEMYKMIGFLHRAREKLELGIAMFATPLSLLHEHIDVVNALIEAHSGQDNAGSSAAVVEPSIEDCRETLGRLRGLGRKHVAPVIRLTQGPPGRVIQQQQQSTHRYLSTAAETIGSAPFEIFVEESPAPAITAQKLISSTPLVRRRLVDDLADDPDYQALFGFFDDREKHDLQFSTLENSSKPTYKFPSSASAVKTKRRGLRHLGIRLPPLDFEVFADDEDNSGQQDPIKEEEVETSTSALTAHDVDGSAGDTNSAAKPPKKSAASKKARLCIRKCLIEEMSLEEGFAARFR